MQLVQSPQQFMRCSIMSCKSINTKPASHYANKCKRIEDRVMEQRQTEQSSSTALWSSWCGKNFSDRGPSRRTRLGSRRDQRFRQEKWRHSCKGRGACLDSEYVVQ